MNNMRKSLIIVALALTGVSAHAQFDFGGGSRSNSGASSSTSTPWSGFKLPKKTMKLDFRNASADMVLALFTKTSGVTIIKDPLLSQPLTLTTAKAVPLNEAFEVLNAALSVRNFEMRKEGNVLVIKQKPTRQQQGGRQGGFDMSAITPEMMSGMMSGGQSNSQLKVYPIKYANASQVARVLNDVFAQSGGGGFNLPFNIGGMGGGGNRGRFGGGGGFNLSALGGNQSTVKASSDDFSNSVIVNAPRAQQTQVEDLIKQIDKQTEEAVKPVVYKLKFAVADEIQPVLQNVLTANAPRGRGGATANQPVDRQFSFFPGLGGGGNNRNAANSLVVSEDRTNSVIVTTTAENQKLVSSIVEELDTEVKLESTTFVFPLDNARADQVSTLLRQAFGNRQGTGTGGNAGAGQNRPNQNQNRNNNNRLGGGGGGGGGGNNFGGGQSNNGLNELLVDLPPGVEEGELMTNVDVQQGGFFGNLFGGGGQQNQNRNTQGSTRFGRNANGQIVPVQDLTGQVTVIPDQNTNSLIVVTTPENAALIRSLIAQLDRIPEQVMIETIIVEASLDSSSKMGIDWKYAQEKAFGQTGTTGTVSSNFGTQAANAQGFSYTLTGGNLTGFINLLKSDQKFNVLSTPRIFTSNNVQAEINISQRVPFVVSQRTDTNGNITFNYDFEDVGIVLTVTPRITAGGYVTMEVSQTANDLQGFTSFNAPIVNQRQADTTVSVKDGDTIILGGIIRSTVTSTVKKIPLLGDIPILGNLFKSTDKSNQKTELVVFLTPRVVRDPEDAKRLNDRMREQLSKPTRDQLDKLNNGGTGGDTKKTTGGGQ